MSQNSNLRQTWTALVLCGLLVGMCPIATVRAQTAPSPVKRELPTSDAPEPESEAGPAEEVSPDELPEADPEVQPEDVALPLEEDAEGVAEGHPLAEVTLTVFPIEFSPGELPLPEPAVRVGGFDIVIVPGPILAGNAAALAAFNRAAAAWESFFSDPITVTINADLADLGGGGVIGTTNPVALEVTAPYNDLRTVWIASADGDDGILSFLPTAANRAFSVNAGYSLSATTLGLKATLKAMGGFGDLDGTLGSTDATITFNTQFAFDYDNSNGVGVGLVDFETTAAHEIGHALGFVSSTDIVDERIHNGLPAIAIYPSLLDYLRFLDGSASDPATALNFSTYVRELRTNQNAITDFIFAVATEGVENRMSTGKWTGDGRQASHWKDDELTGTRLGIMDPTLPAQAVWTISRADARALDLIGYDVVLEDCNNNGFDDDDEIAMGTSADCNANGTPDDCDIAAGAPDCNGNGTLDGCELAGNDCNANGTPDECDTQVLDQSNTPTGDLGGTFMFPDNFQTFQPSQPWLGGVDIGIQASTPNVSETVGVQIRRGAQIIASASQVVSANFNGLLHFDLPTTPVVPGETLILAAVSPSTVFHWQYGNDTYPNGQRHLFGSPAFGDWVFQTYGTAGDCNRDLVPDTCQLAGNDCNGTGTPDDCELVVPGPSSYSTSPNLAIPDNNGTGVSSVINVPEGGVISDVDVALHINHIWQGDLAVTLSHAGVTRTLIYRAGLCSNATFGYSASNFGSAGNLLVLDDAAATSIDCYAGVSSGINNYAGPARPNQPLSAFNGLNPAGAWTLTVSDVWPGFTGTLVTWRLDLEGTDTSADCNDNGIPDECEPDCNANGIADGCDISGGGSDDCNANGTPDDCELAGNDCDGNAVPDECEPDCNANGIADGCDLLFPDHNCCATGHGAGCSDPGIQGCVCATDSYCCTVDWDSICTGEVQGLGCGSCGPASDDCNANATPDECDLAHNCCATGHGTGCSQPNIQACVCAADPYCCNVAWDSICAGEVQSLGCGTCGGASEDCNANGTPDECDGGCVPAATVTGAVSRKANAGGPGGVCDLSLVPGPGSEPRQGGITEVRIAFDVAPGNPGATPVTLESATCAAPTYTAYAGASSVAAAVAGNELVLTLTPGLENARTYRINLGSAVTSTPGQFVEVSGLLGDVNGDGFTNATDRSVVVSVWTGASHFSCTTDLNGDGSTNATDRSVIVSSWTSGQNCAP